jgi:hypothetical protein
LLAPFLTAAILFPCCTALPTLLPPLRGCRGRSASGVRRGPRFALFLSPIGFFSFLFLFCATNLTVFICSRQTSQRLSRKIEDENQQKVFYLLVHDRMTIHSEQGRGMMKFTNKIVRLVEHAESLRRSPSATPFSSATALRAFQVYSKSSLKRPSLIRNSLLCGQSSCQTTAIHFERF